MIVTGLGTGFGGGLAVDAVLALVAWRAIYLPYLRISPQEVTIQNALRSYSFPWTDLAGVSPGQYGLYFTLSNGQEISASVIQKSPLAMMFTWIHTRADSVEEAVRTHAAAGGASVPTP